MRLFHLLSLSLVSTLGVLACSSSSTSGNVAPDDASTPTEPSDGGPGITPEAPLTAHPVCATLEVDTNLGRGCSGTGQGQEVCAFADTACAANKCVYDNRKNGFEFYCAPKCKVGDATECPLGFECVAPTASCANDAAAGVCTKRVGYTCDDKIELTGTLFEGAGGELYAVNWDGSNATVRVKSGSAARIVGTWTEPSSSSYLVAIARTADTTLLVTADGFDVAIKDGAVRAAKRKASFRGTLGVAADGSFVALEDTGGFAALMKRGDDGAWTEVGPTSKRVSEIKSTARGFVAKCGANLCASADGQKFETVALPPGVTFDEKSRFGAAGASSDDFYFTTAGRLFHHRKGAWVEEGPKAAPSSTSSDRLDILRASVKGTVAFHTWNGTSYTTYVSTDGCWKTTPAGNLDNTVLAGDGFFWNLTTGRKGICTMPVK